MQLSRFHLSAIAGYCTTSPTKQPPSLKRPRYAILVALLDGHDVERVVGSRAIDCGWQSLEAQYRASLT
jgi:hypothetical protein